MYSTLTAVVLVLSGIYDGYRLLLAINTFSASAMTSVSPDTAAYGVLENVKNTALIEIIICSVLLILTIICIIRFIRLAIIGNIIYLTHNTTKDFIKTTNGSGSDNATVFNKQKKPRSTGGMRITNSDNDSDQTS